MERATPPAMRGFYAWVAVAWTLWWAYWMVALMATAHPALKVILK